MTHAGDRHAEKSVIDDGYRVERNLNFKSLHHGAFIML
jgi:hypothetical protein